MSITIDQAKLTKLIAEELTCDDGSISTTILIGRTTGHQIQLTITKDKDDFMDLPMNHRCIKVTK